MSKKPSAVKFYMPFKTALLAGALTSLFWGGLAIAGIISHIWLLLVIAGALSALALTRIILALRVGEAAWKLNRASWRR